MCVGGGGGHAFGYVKVGEYVCVCVIAKCVWWGRCVCLEKGSGFNVLCKVVWCQGGYFWKVITLMNFRSGTRYTGHS